MNETPKHQGAFAEKPHHDNALIMALCVCAIALFGYQVFQESFTFDVWYIIATGREIVQNGIPQDNVFSMIPDMRIVVQQWLLCVIFHLIYEAAGFGGLGVFVVLVFFATIFVLYRIMRVKRRDSFGGEWILLFLLPVMLVIQTRFIMASTPVSILILATLVLLLELYRRDGSYGYLGCIVGLIVLHMQVHMAFIGFDIGIIICYLIPDLVSSRNQLIGLAQSDYRRIPLLILLIASLLATLINPYGIDGALYIIDSMGAATYGNVIPELLPQTLSIYGWVGFMALGLVVVSAIAIGKAGLRSIDLPAVLIFLGCLYLGFAYRRNIFMLGLPVVLLGADMMRGWYIPLFSTWPNRKAGKEIAGPSPGIGAPRWAIYPPWITFACTVLCAAGIGVLVFRTAMDFNVLDENAINARYAPQSMLEAIQRNAADNEGSSDSLDDLRIFNPTVLGGYMEWEGFPVYNDSRPEIWNSAISGLDRDLHNEYVDMTLGRWTTEQFDQFIAENDFDYLIAEVNSPLDGYLAQQEGFQNIMGSQYYELYGKK